PQCLCGCARVHGSVPLRPTPPRFALKLRILPMFPPGLLPLLLWRRGLGRGGRSLASILIQQQWGWGEGALHRENCGEGERLSNRIDPAKRQSAKTKIANLFPR